MIIPGFIFSLIFAPGLPIHELSHIIMCKAFGLKVRRVQWWGLNGAYVQHEKPKRVYQSILITLAPFLIANLIAIAFMLLGAAAANVFLQLGWFFMWIGVSAAFFSFPSLQDSKNAINAMQEFMNSSWKRHREEMKKSSMGAVKIILDILIFIYIFLPLIAILLAMVVVGYFLILSLIWVFLLMGSIGLAPPLGEIAREFGI